MFLKDLHSLQLNKMAGKVLSMVFVEENRNLLKVGDSQSLCSRMIEGGAQTIRNGPSC